MIKKKNQAIFELWGAVNEKSFYLIGWLEEENRCSFIKNILI